MQQLKYLSIPLAILLLATLVMIPRLLQPSFGLLDDGVSLFWGSLSTQEGLLSTVVKAVQEDGKRGRFHPIHWLSLILEFLLCGYKPGLWFFVNWLLLTATALLIARIVWVGSKDKLAALFSGLGYLLLPSVFENYYTLSKSEPLLVFLLAMSAWLLFESILKRGLMRRGMFWASCAFLALAYYTKETALAMTVTSLIWACFEVRRSYKSQSHVTGWTMRSFFAANLVLFASFFLSRNLVEIASMTTASDSQNYLLSVSSILESVLQYSGWYVRDYAHVLIALGFLWVLHLWGMSKTSSEWFLGVCLGWVVGATAIMLPWHTSLLYYLLPVNIAAAMILGLGLSRIVQHLRDNSRPATITARLALVLFVPLAAISCLNGLTHGRVQIAVDRSNAEMINTLASTIPKDGTVLVHLPAENEYLFELGFHFQILKDRDDINIQAFQTADLENISSNTFIVAAEMNNQPLPSVRIGVHESGAKVWQAEVEEALAGRVQLVTDISDQTRLALFALEKPIFGMLFGRQRWRGLFYYGGMVPSLDFRKFEYGWQIYRISSS